MTHNYEAWFELWETEQDEQYYLSEVVLGSQLKDVVEQCADIIGYAENCAGYVGLGQDVELPKTPSVRVALSRGGGKAALRTRFETDDGKWLAVFWFEKVRCPYCGTPTEHGE